MKCGFNCIIRWFSFPELNMTKSQHSYCGIPIIFRDWFKDKFLSYFFLSWEFSIAEILILFMLLLELNCKHISWGWSVEGDRSKSTGWNDIN